MNHVAVFFTGALMLCALNTSAAPAAKMTTKNPLLEKWKGPYGGVPPFDKVKIADIKPALEEAIVQYRAEIQTIANNPKPATFENTIAELERAGQTMNRVQTIYGVWTTAM